MAPFVDAGQFMDVSDVWAANGLIESLASAAASMTIDGKQWGVPYTYYQWGIYYNKDVYKAVGVEVPTTWDEFVANCEKFKAAGIDCLTTGTKALWPGAGIFDYLNLRTNGYEFHMELTAGKVAWTDDTREARPLRNGPSCSRYITANHAAIDWQDAAALLVQGKAANYVMGNFAVGVFKEGGMTNDTLGFMAVPENQPRRRRAPKRRRPTRSTSPPAPRTSTMPRSSSPSWRSADAQTKLNAALGQLADQQGLDRRRRPVPRRPGSSCCRPLQAASRSSLTATRRPKWPRSGWRASRSSWCSPDQLDAILERLETARSRIYK